MLAPTLPRQLRSWIALLLVACGSAPVERAPAPASTGPVAATVAAPAAQATRGPDPMNGKRHALVIGIDGYGGAVAPACADRGWRPLAGARNDARAMVEALRAKGFGDIRTLIDGDPTSRPPTRANILAALDALANPAWRGHVVAFYFAGHGSQIAAPSGAGADATEPFWETIVPLDTATDCAPDISDKELRERFNRVLDAIDPGDTRDGALTIMLDSCHSGSGVRGPGATRSVRVGASVEPPPSRSFGPPLESRNAVILAATSKDQLASESVDERGEVHGAFTLALLGALSEAPPDDTAASLFGRVRARMGFKGQTPSLSPPGSTRVVFGRDVLARDGLLLHVIAFPNGTLGVDAGTAVGLFPGSILRRRGAAPLEVTTSTAGFATSELVDGTGLAVADELEVVAWAGGDRFTVFVPSDPPGADALYALRKELDVLARRRELTLVRDPVTEPRTHLVWYEASRWWLQGSATDRGSVELGETFAADAVLRALRAERAAAPRVLVALPPPRELVADPRFGLAPDSAGVPASARPILKVVTRLADGPAYALTARLDAAAGLEVAWINGALSPPVRSSDEAPATSPLPAGTRWVPADPRHAGEVRDLVDRLRFLDQWARLESPLPDRFPYALRLRPHVAGGQPAGAGWQRPSEVRAGERWELGLVPLEGAARGEGRFVYAFVMSQDGSGCFLYPRTGGSNRYPRAGEPMSPVVLDIDPWGDDDHVRICQPCGTETYVLVSAERELDLYGAFRTIGLDPERSDCWPGVQRVRADAAFDGLAAVLQGAMVGQRASPPKARTAGRWGIQRVVARSVGCPFACEED